MAVSKEKAFFFRTIERTILELHHVGITVDLCHATVLAESCVGRRQHSGDGSPDPPSAAVRREAKGCVGTPVSCYLVQYDISRQQLYIRRGNTFSKPRSVHLSSISLTCIGAKTRQASLGEHAYLACRNSPDFEVIGAHEDLREPLSDVSDVPFVKVLGLVGRGASSCVERCVNQALHAPGLLLLGSTAMLF